ncbi:MAG: hypothetical protein IPL55_00840 [Saprospiraceae bacterium]|nr:hypothetical protein [Saprospiraceae bacterium]
MKISLFPILLVIFLTSCSSGQKQPVLFDFNPFPCDLASQSDIAKALNLSVVDVLFQSVTNQGDIKVCTYFKNSKPTPEPLIHLTVESNIVNPSNYDNLFMNFKNNGIPSSEGTSMFKSFPDERFKAIYSEDNPKFNQVYLNIDDKYLLNLQYDKSLAKGKENVELARKMIEIFLYGGPNQ